MSAVSALRRAMVALRCSGMFAAIVMSTSVGHAAFIDPADGTGSFGTDPGTWAASFPAMNTNTVQGSAPTFPAAGGEITATVRSLAPWTRGAANTTYQSWDRFFPPTTDPVTPLVGTPIPANTSAVPNEVDANPINPYGTATVTTTLAGAFNTSGGNIYSPTSATAYSVAIPNANLGAGYQTNFLVQIRASTGLFDFSSFQINGTPLSSLGNYSLQLIDRWVYDSGFGGDTAALDYKLEFTLPGNAALNTLTFGSAGPGLSFDKLSIDTSVSLAAVPEPSSLILASLMALPGYALLRRRKHAGR